MTVTADRVKESTTTTGTGTYSLGGASTGFRAFSSAFLSGQVVFYCCESGSDWEVGEGTLTTGTPWTLARTTILASSNSGSAIDWAAGSKNIFATLPRQGFREVLTTNRTYYVRTDGSDSNSGFEDTSGGAFLTIQKAVNVVSSTLDIASGVVVTIQVGAGTYTAGALLRSFVGGGDVVIQGDTTTPSNVLIQNNSGIGFSAGGAMVYTVKGFKITNSSNMHAIFIGYNSMVTIQSMEFGAVGTARHIYVGAAGELAIGGSYTISGGASYHWLADHGGSIRSAGTTTITLTGTPAFTAFAYASRGSRIYPSVSNFTFSGSATGKRYDIVKNSVCDTDSGGSTFLPGSVAGTTATGGIYA